MDGQRRPPAAGMGGDRMTFPAAPPTTMPPLGADTVGFQTLDYSGTRDGMGEITPTPTTVNVAGCRHRALTASETPVELLDIGTQVWQTHAPPVAAALPWNPSTNPSGAKLSGQLVVNGVTYEIVGGPQPFTDDSGQVLFVKLLSKVEHG